MYRGLHAGASNHVRRRENAKRNLAQLTRMEEVTGLRRPEQWRSRGEQSWKNQKEQRETLPVILLLRQVFQVSSRVYLLTCIFEIIKLAIPLVMAVPSSVRSALNVNPSSMLAAVSSTVQSKAISVAALLPAPAKAVSPALAVAWLAIQGVAGIVWNAAFGTAMFLWSAVVAAAKDLAWVATVLFSLLLSLFKAVAAWFASLLSSEAPGIILFRQDLVFYILVTVGLRMMASFYADHEDWITAQNPKRWSLVDSTLFNVGVGLPLAALLVATAVGGGRLLFGGLLAYYFCVCVQVGMVDLLTEELRSPMWTVVDVPYTAWRLLQLQALGPVFVTSLAPVAEMSGFWGGTASLLCSSILPITSAAWILLCARHLLQVPALYRWRRQPDKSDLEKLEQLRTSVENLRLQTENLKQGRLGERIRIDTWGSGTLERSSERST